MPILELGRLRVCELRCIGPKHEQHERVPVELHPAIRPGSCRARYETSRDEEVTLPCKGRTLMKDLDRA
jgi:hypothetical protein